MALFKFRKGRDEPSASVAPAQTVEAVRRRAMHRLIGAAVLVLAGVIGFPLIFDNQPRPIPVDLPIDIVDPGKAKPLAMPPVATNTAAAAAVSAPAASAAEPAVAAKPTDTQPKATATAPPPATAAPAPPAAPVVAAQAPAPAPEKTASSAAEIAEAKAQDARKARALLEGRPLAGSSKTAVMAAGSPAAASAKAAAASDDRFVVQVGAFADAAKAREVRLKVEAAGLKTYTQVVKTSDGERTRVRVGPFADKGEATKAADKIRKLNLSAAILTL